MPKRDQLTYEDLLEIVELIKSSAQFSEFHLKVGDIEVDLRRRADPGAAQSPAPSAPHVAAQRSAGMTDADRPLPAAAAAPEPRPASTQDWPEGSVVLRSPMVGTFYRAPEPGAPPFVQVGQAVTPEATVCIIEVMKLMNSIPAGASGVVTHILVEDAAPVEYGQPLIVLGPR